MKKLFTILFLLGFVAVYAQNSLSGKITDTNNQPLEGVEIYAPMLHKGTTTNQKGEYTLKNIPNGEITINVTFLGYKTITKTFSFKNNSITDNFSLKEAIFEIDEVIVSTPFNKLQSDNVMKVDRLTAKSLQKTGASSLAEGITNIAGVSQISTGIGIGKPVIRGLSGNRVLVYTQGVRLENQQYGSEHGLGLSDNGIQSIEVIKGPASLLYGSDALGGVLYINPEKFAPENKSQLLFGQRYFSNTLGSNTTIGLKHSGNLWNFLARGTYALHSDYKIPTNQRVTNTRFKEKDLKLGVGFNKDYFTSELRYNFNNTVVGIPEEGIKEQTTTTTPENPYQKINNHVISLHNHIFFGDSKLDADFGYIINDRSEFEEHEDHDEDETEEEHEEHGDEAALRMKLKTFSYNLKYHLPKFGDFETLVGIQGMHQTNKNFGEELLIPNAKVNDFGAFVTANYEWNDINTLQAGVRFDNRAITTERHEVQHEDETHIFNAIDKSFNSFTASLGFKTLLFKHLDTRINIATGFRAPNLAELTSNGVHHGTNRFEVGNNNLSTEKNIQVDLSFEYDTEHFELFANGFYNSINDYIFIAPTGEVEDGAPVFRFTQEDAKLYGGEFGFHLHPHPLDWLHLESSFETVIGKQNNGSYLPLIPANTWKNSFRGEFNVSNWLQSGYASVSLNTTFDQNNISSFETKTNGYSLVNLGFGGDLIFGKTKFNTSISVNNLFNKKYINHLSRLKSDGILNAGRNIVLGLRFTI
ncbi:TonB-dependent receptor [Tenacibaculum holothuriorum]|uniref:TonB-dependent receptor n=1 Tax=Tenacibaculum holothuriorum TaxID=1635173 RepID=A0A1Y2PG65_9FLAO|nr:TonB-dependent receptor [Tenacibaculum holothuriorum]OSY89474.1 TonB-dependent receptor [Tenacibaculum holothuriorum]